MLWNPEYGSVVNEAGLLSPAHTSLGDVREGQHLRLSYEGSFLRCTQGVQHQGVQHGENTW